MAVGVLPLLLSKVTLMCHVLPCHCLATFLTCMPV
jgi:hypothetical protein